MRLARSESENPVPQQSSLRLVFTSLLHDDFCVTVSLLDVSCVLEWSGLFAALLRTTTIIITVILVTIIVTILSY